MKRTRPELSITRLAACLILIPAGLGAQDAVTWQHTAPHVGDHVGDLTHVYGSDDIKNAFAQADAGRISRPKIFYFTGQKPEAELQLSEDLRTMAYILDDARNRVDPQNEEVYRLGIAVKTLQGLNPAVVESAYIEGFGAHFRLSVNFPVVKPKSEITKKEENKRPEDATWQSARKRVLGGDSQMMRRAWLDRTRRHGVPVYSASKVEALTQGMREALKQAANIRGLADDDYVAVTIAAPVAQAELRSAWEPLSQTPAGAAAPAVAWAWAGAIHDGGKGFTSRFSHAFLSLRIKKRDVTQLAEGTLRAEDFNTRIEVTAYESAVAR